VFLFANADKQKLSRVLSEHGIEIKAWNEWTSDYTCLLIDTGRYKVLIDTGAGGLAPTTGKLIPNLKQAGIPPEDIDLVILTHGHPDHVGGNLDARGNPAFPRARWVMNKDEWAFWTSEEAKSRLAEHGRETLIGIARHNLLPLEGKIDLPGEEAEIVPGIRPIFSPGHTPGLMTISVSSDGARLLYLSDVVIHPVHVAEPDWFAGTDVIPDQVISTRRRLLDMAARGRHLVMAFHFPFPGLGYITQDDQRWRWQPLDDPV
jgi:glyoxylase-like metal-dependent hydrolase (beta-lactamase superfamily II)